MTRPLQSLAFADDEPSVLRVLELACKSHYKIVGIAKDGQEALTLVKIAKPNVLVLDVHMPVLDGLEVLKQVAILQTTAVVMLTADQDRELARQAMDSGAAGYVTKPFEFSQIIPMLETAWHRFQTMQTLQDELAKMSENLETRKLLEKAKGILIEQQGYTEDMAHKTLQKMSQDQGISLKEVCRSLIQVRMVLGKMVPKKAA